KSAGPPAISSGHPPVIPLTPAQRASLLVPFVIVLAAGALQFSDVLRLSGLRFSEPPDTMGALTLGAAWWLFPYGGGGTVAALTARVTAANPPRPVGKGTRRVFGGVCLLCISLAIHFLAGLWLDSPGVVDSGSRIARFYGAVLLLLAAWLVCPLRARWRITEAADIYPESPPHPAPSDV
ncbi:MAG TPA: hypothetical protein VHM91_18395, partial [Verrucomicrobiales bacterium]|nr:hypothetical protein [Verrucomicrobiales bacterium]